MSTKAPGNRLLEALRISVSGDDSTSLARQEISLDTAASRQAWQVVGQAVDDGVSASKVAPIDRPGLSPWLSDTALIAQYDVIGWWRMDRAIRSMRDLHWLAGWAKDHNKRLYFAEGPGGGSLELDMSTPMGMLMATIIAFAAEMEAEAIRERALSSQRYLATQARWPSGTAPYGYTVIDLPGGGKGLAVNPEQAKVIRWIVERVLNGWSLLRIADDLNARQIPSPNAGFKVRKTKNRKRKVSQGWAHGSLRAILRSERILGWKVSKGKVVYRDGEPIIMAPGIIDVATFNRVQAVLDSRTPASRTRELSELLHVVWCGQCQGLHTYDAGGTRTAKTGARAGRTYTIQPAYKCRGDNGKACRNSRVSDAALKAAISSEFMTNVGHLDRPEKVFIPGEDHTAELEAVARSIRLLKAEADAGLVEDETEYMTRLTGLTERKNKLASLPQRTDAWEERPSGRTWGDWWEDVTDWHERRDLLLDAGVRVYVYPDKLMVMQWPEKLTGKEGKTLIVTA